MILEAMEKMQGDPRTFRNLRGLDADRNERIGASQTGLIQKRRGTLEMFERLFGHLPAPAGSFKVACLDQVGFVDIFERVLVFLHGGGERIHADRPASEFINNGEENPPVHIIESSRIDSQPG